jgi:hypothetical protein
MLLSHMHRFSLKIAAGLLATAILLAASGLATAAPKPVKNLWSTINICDTKKHPNIVGVRGRMPGNGDSKQTMYVKLLIQFKNSKGKWVQVTKNGTSPWLKAGNAKFTWGENGWNFSISIKKGQKFNFRGQAKYEWRKTGNVVRSGARYTTSGHQTAKSDPEGYSAATCTVKG